METKFTYSGRPLKEFTDSVKEVPSEELTLPEAHRLLLEKMHDTDAATAAHQERVGSAAETVLRPHLGLMAARGFGFAGEVHDIGKYDPGVNRLTHSSNVYARDSEEWRIIQSHEPTGRETLNAVGDTFAESDASDEVPVWRMSAMAAGGELKPGKEISAEHGYDARALAIGGAALHFADVSDALLAPEGREYREARQLENKETNKTPEEILQNEITRLYGENEREPFKGFNTTPRELGAAAMREVRRMHAASE